MRPEVLHDAQVRYPHVVVESALSAMLHDPTIDAVVVATPPAAHVTVAEAALNAGKHVWVEKPLALTYTEGQRLVALAHAQRRALFVDETFLYDPLVEQLRLWLAAGVIGEPHHVTLERTGMGRVRRDSDVWWNSAPHDVSILHYVLNTRVCAIAVSGHAFVQPGIVDAVWASLQMEGRLMAHIHLHWLFPEKKAPLTIVGERGMLRYEGRFEQRRLTRYGYQLGPIASETRGAANVIPIQQYQVEEEVCGDPVEPLVRASRAFREMIHSGEPAPSSGERSLRTLAVLEAGAQSLAQNGAWVAVPRK
jgi:predicted dehydrogenase